MLSEHEKDVITITIYSNKVLIESETFGWALNYSGKWEYEERKSICTTEKGEQFESISDYYFCDQKYIAYLRSNEKKVVQPLMQINPNNGYFYNFNVVYGELYDFKTNKWIYGAAGLATNKEKDKVYMKLRATIGRHFCSNFIPSLADDLHFGNDSWDID